MRSINHSKESTFKENNGKGARIAFRRRVLLFGGGICALVMLLLFIIADGDDVTTYAAGDDVNGIRMDTRFGRRKSEMRPNIGRDGKMMSGVSLFNSKLTEGEKLEMIVSASVHLVDLLVRENAFYGSEDGELYRNVKGVFCTLDWAKHKKDPSANAMFRELVSESSDCNNNRFMMDLGIVMNAVFEHDLGGHDVNVLEPTGFVFHESRCGSTLVANILAAFAPERSRVYTESPPPASVLTACRTSRCNPKKQAALFRDVLYLMGRTNDLMEKHLFFKFQSISSLHVDIVQLAFPDVPWIFVYRDPVQVMMSHLANGANSKKAKCLKTRYSPSRETQSLVQHKAQLSTDMLSPEDFCAAYLATLCDSILREARVSRTGRMVNYSDLPNVLMDDILPTYFLPLDTKFGEKEKQNILLISEIYSKGRHGKTKRWVEDSDNKELMASDKIRQAASTYLQAVYIELNEHTISK